MARAAADVAGVSVEWHCADMRDIPAEWAGRFDYIINIFTAFGYFRGRGRESARAGRCGTGAQDRAGDS